MLKSLWNSFFHEINSCEPFFIKLYQFSLELEKFSAKFLNIQICYVIWTLWLCHEWITIYSWKNAAFNKKFWLDGIKYCYKDLFQYFLMKGQCWFYLIRYSNLKMVQFWKKIGKFWPENTDISKNSAEKAWYLKVTSAKKLFFVIKLPLMCN